MEKQEKKTASLAVDLSKIHYSEIEQNPKFNYDKLRDAEKKALDDEVDKYMETKVAPMFIKRFEPCHCRKSTMKKRAAEGKAAITQEDLDERDYGVVANADCGHPKKIRALVMRCRRCGRTTLYTIDFDGYMDMLMRSFNNFDIATAPANGIGVKAPPVDAKEDPYKDYMFENLETGEMTPAGDVMRKLLGDDGGFEKAD